jgi:hypothetical protein
MRLHLANEHLIFGNITGKVIISPDGGESW